MRALLLQIFYSVRSERLLVEQLQYNLLFRWFVGMDIDEEVWNHAVFSKNRERLLNEDVAEAFFQRVLIEERHCQFFERIGLSVQAGQIHSL